METGDLVSILGRSRRHGFRRWGTATVVRSGATVMQVQFEGSEPLDAYPWNALDAALDLPSSRSVLFARPLPSFLRNDERSRA